MEGEEGAGPDVELLNVAAVALAPEGLHPDCVLVSRLTRLGTGQRGILLGEPGNRLAELLPLRPLLHA